jgi:hypothetical protein
VSLPFDFHPAVRDEIDDAYDWYERRQTHGKRTSRAV